TEGRWLDLGKGRGQLRLEAGVVGGIDSETAERGLSLRYRRGGEEFCPAGRRRTHKLKKLLQEEAIVPWMREQIPLLYSGDRLVAVGDLWIAADASNANGFGVRWRNRPALH
ncbi:MAG: tRNA lysidine(34) synthetase TilS, partial [Woeseiaceae bacterium]